MNVKIPYLQSILDLSTKPLHIKLLGDSITHGVGGTGFAQNGDPIVDGFARNPDGYCWANLFREYMQKHYGCVVSNNACTGTNIEFILEHFDELVDKKDDLIICMIGTNNRHQYFHDSLKHTPEEHLDGFYQNIIKLHQRFVDAGKPVIFMAGIPASAENEKDGEDYWRLFHMDDVCKSYKKASEEQGFPLISMYDLFLDYCDTNKIAVDSLLPDGLHPSDTGYEVMFQLITQALFDDI
jgi:lysophospholipase L1-like esterase